MARNRQRAKQRQAQRRAERLDRRGRDGGDGAAPAPPPEGEAPPRPEEPAPETERPSPPAADEGTSGSAPEVERPTEPPPGDDMLERADLAASAPPEDLGRSDAVLEPDPADEAELPDYDPEDEEQPLAAEAVAAGRPPAEGKPERRRGRVLEFLANVWAELQRVQWPNRQQVTTLTGVVLGFVLIAGGYLGLLDAIFSRVIEAIL